MKRNSVAMWVKFWNTFTKITGWPLQKLVFRIRVFYEDEAVQKRRIKGPAIIISNHTSVFDFAAFMFVFFSRTLRYQMAEVLFEKKWLRVFLKMWGGIFVDRKNPGYGCVAKSLDILKNGGVVGIFPESRLPLPGEERPLPFKTGAAYIALMSGVPIIPVYTDGQYFTWKRAHVLIGKPIEAASLIDPQKEDKENVVLVSEELRRRIIELGRMLDEKKG